MHRFTLLRSEKEQIRERRRAALEPREEVLFAYLHGSFLLEVPFEDVDVAVYLRERTSNQQDSLQYASYLSNTLERLLGLPVDVHVLNHAPWGM